MTDETIRDMWEEALRMAKDVNGLTKHMGDYIHGPESPESKSMYPELLAAKELFMEKARGAISEATADIHKELYDTPDKPKGISSDVFSKGDRWSCYDEPKGPEGPKGGYGVAGDVFLDMDAGYKYKRGLASWDKVKDYYSGNEFTNDELDEEVIFRIQSYVPKFNPALHRDPYQKQKEVFYITKNNVRVGKEYNNKKMAIKHANNQLIILVDQQNEDKRLAIEALYEDNPDHGAF